MRCHVQMSNFLLHSMVVHVWWKMWLPRQIRRKEIDICVTEAGRVWIYRNAKILNNVWISEIHATERLTVLLRMMNLSVILQRFNAPPSIIAWHMLSFVFTQKCQSLILFLTSWWYQCWIYIFFATIRFIDTVFLHVKHSKFLDICNMFYSTNKLKVLSLPWIIFLFYPRHVSQILNGWVFYIWVRTAFLSGET